MDQYAEIIGNNASVDDYRKIAGHFENSGDHYKAGNFFFASKDYDKVHLCFICFNAIVLYDFSGFASPSSLPCDT